MKNYINSIRKKTFYLNVILSVITLMTLSSCETNALSDLVAEDVEEPPLELVTYNNTARAIIDNACVECHSTVIPTAGIILDSFETARAVAESGRMIIRMTDTGNPMPPAGNLPDPIIQDIMDWIDDGLLEN